MLRTSTQFTLYRRILIFWLPMLATWLMMSLEGPLLAALIARLVEPKYNLAAYGVAFSLALIVEAPIIMMMSASTALVKNRASYLKLRNFTAALNALITLVMIVILIPPVFTFLAEDLIGLPAKVSDLTYTATLLLLPWPGAIGFRRFYQGLLIRNNQTRKVAYGTVIRLVSLAGTAFLLFMFTDLPGAALGAAALSVGVCIESAISRLMTRNVIHKYLSGELSAPESEKSLSYREIFVFYYPLALTSILALGVYPLVTFFMGQSRYSLESLAVFPVINSLVFIFRAFGLSFQEVAIAKFGDNFEYYIPIRNIAVGLGVAAMGGLGLIAFTPLAGVWFSTLSGLSAELTAFAIPPTRILVLIPAASVMLAFQRAVLVNAKKTGPITMATVLEVGFIIVALMLLIGWADLVGAVAAAIALFAGRIAANAWLTPPVRAAFRNSPGGERS